MTRVRFLAVAAVCASSAVLLAFAERTAAAPVPKDAGKNNFTPELKAVFDAVAKSVKDKKWPQEDGETLMRASAQVAFDRTIKAANEKPRKFPVEFGKLKKLGPVREFKNKENGADGA